MPQLPWMRKSPFLFHKGIEKSCLHASSDIFRQYCLDSERSVLCPDIAVSKCLGTALSLELRVCHPWCRGMNRGERNKQGIEFVEVLHERIMRKKRLCWFNGWEAYAEMFQGMDLTRRGFSLPAVKAFWVLVVLVGGGCPSAKCPYVTPGSVPACFTLSHFALFQLKDGSETYKIFS